MNRDFIRAIVVLTTFCSLGFVTTVARTGEAQEPAAPAAPAAPIENEAEENGADEQDHSFIPYVDEVAAAYTAGMERTWEGPRVHMPDESARPSVPLAVRSVEHPLAVHASSDATPEQLDVVMDALTEAQTYLASGGWPAPFNDAGRGGGDGLDLYLVPTSGFADAKIDARVEWSFLDTASTFALVDSSLTGQALRACVVSAYTQAVLLSQDPAEAHSWRRATAEWLTWSLTGEFGCRDQVSEQQQASWRSWIPSDPVVEPERREHDGSGGALFLAMLSQRYDGGSGVFLRELWQLTRQRTWEGQGLRADPDLFGSLNAVIEGREEKVVDLIGELAVARYFMGSAERDRGAFYPALRRLSSEAIPPTFEINEFPKHTAAAGQVEPWGTRYATVDLSDANPGDRLRVWLRGEYGVEWLLTASTINAAGREIARIAAPPRRRERRSYVPIELRGEEKSVLLAITNLSSRLPDADTLDENIRSFRLVVDIVRVGEDADVNDDDDE